MIKAHTIYSPFKFLDAYEAADRQEFFGRDLEIAELYQRVYESDLVLLYGTSGTGKTSLINCGLANEFDPTDWLPVYVYREARKLTASLRAAIEAEATKIGKDFSDTDHIADQLLHLGRLHFKPVYLIFDQFEELFILGDEEEQLEFFESLAEILDRGGSVKVLISMREEYLGNLYPYEAILPSLFNRRLRIEPMSTLQATEVILQSCERFNIRLEDPEENAARILEQVQPDSGSEISLPYLQVYLDQFYREDLLRTYPNGIPDVPYPALEFSTKEIKSFGQIANILQNFLADQESQIQTALAQQFPGISPVAVKKVLGQFVSLEGTKIPIRREGFKVAPLREEELAFILEKLEESRILKGSDKVLSLIHDSLAARIAGQRDADEITLIRNAQLVKNRYREFQRIKTWLSTKELSLIENFEHILREEERLSPEEWEFIDDSRKEQRRKRIKRWILISGSFIVLLTLLLIASIQWQAATVAKDQAQSALLDSYLDRQESQHLRLEKTRNTIEIMHRAEEDSIMQVYVGQANVLMRDSIELAHRIRELAAGLRAYHEAELQQANEALAKTESDSMTQYLESLKKKIQLSYVTE